MELENDFSDMTDCLNSNNCKFVIVGGLALAFNGYIRNTGDIDFFVEPSLDNSFKVYKALQEFGAPLSEIKDTDFAQEGIIFQIGLPPIRIDIINSIDGVSFEDAYSTRLFKKIGNTVYPYMSIELLKRNKLASGRAKDLIDIEELEKL